MKGWLVEGAFRKLLVAGACSAVFVLVGACSSSNDATPTDTGDAGDASADACVVPGPKDGGSFACGPNSCTTAQYCQTFPDAPSYECIPIPRDCVDCPSCDCVPFPITSAECTCSAGINGIKVVCK